MVVDFKEDVTYKIRAGHLGDASHVEISLGG